MFRLGMIEEKLYIVLSGKTFLRVSSTAYIGVDYDSGRY